MNLFSKKAAVKSSTTAHGLKVFCSTGPGVLRLWIPFKHQLFIEYVRGDNKPLDAYDDIPELSRNPKYIALVTKTFDQIMIKDDKIEVHIKLEKDELKLQSEKASHPELNQWLEDVAQIIIAYNRQITKRSPSLGLMLDQMSAWMVKYFILTIPAMAAISYPFISKASYSMLEWKDKVELLIGFGFVFMGLLTILKVKLWLRIFARFYILILSGLMLAFLAMRGLYS